MVGELIYADIQVAGDEESAGARRWSIQWRAVIVLFFLVACWVAGGPAGAADWRDREVAFDIAPQSLDHALLQFSSQSGLQIMLAANSAGNAVTSGIRGTFRVSDALARLLQGSGLSFSASGDTVIVAPAAVSTAHATGEQSR